MATSLTVSAIAAPDHRWAELDAAPATPAIQVSQADSRDSSGGSSTVEATQAVTGVTASAMSSGMDAALSAFSAWSSENAGQPSPEVSASAQLLNDLRSLLSDLGTNTGNDIGGMASAGTHSTGPQNDPQATGDSIIAFDAGSPDRLNAFMQQFAMAAYSSGYASGTETDAPSKSSVKA